MIDFGFLIIDKPPGPICHEITTFIKKTLNSKKAGHSGTLDPNVSGVLPIAIGKSTRLLEFISKKEKQYVCVAKFKNQIQEKQIKKTLLSFVGENYQTPPKISAVKKSLRKRTIYSIDFLEILKNRCLFKVKCEAGTYIRVLCNQIGESLNNFCEMEELRRISAGNFNIKDSNKIEDVIDAMWFFKEKKDPSYLKKILRPSIELLNFPKVKIKNNVKKNLLLGSPLFLNGIKNIENDFLKEDLVSLIDEKNNLISISKTNFSSDFLKENKYLKKPIFFTKKFIGEDFNSNFIF